MSIEEVRVGEEMSPARWARRSRRSDERGELVSFEGGVLEDEEERLPACRRREADHR